MGKIRKAEMSKQMTSQQILRRVVERQNPNFGCSDSGCVFGHSGGMGTNGGCGCLKDAEKNPLRLHHMIYVMRQAALTIAAFVEMPAIKTRAVEKQ